MRWVLLLLVAMAGGALWAALASDAPVDAQVEVVDAPSRLARSDRAALELPRLARLLERRDTPAAEEALAPPPLLQLQGTLREVEADRSLALVVAGGRARVVMLGTDLDGWLVDVIEQRRVGLRRGGRRHWVTFDDPSPRFEPEVMRSTPSASKVHTFQRAELERRVASQSDVVLQTTRVTPLFLSGTVRGFRLDFTEASPLRDVGLASGDVVVAVNGQPASPRLAMELATRWKALRQVELRVERGGQPLVFNYRIE